MGGCLKLYGIYCILLVITSFFLLNACKTIVEEPVIRPQYTSVSTCASIEDPNDIKDEYITHGRIIDKKIFDKSKYIVFFIENMHDNPFEILEDYSKIISIQNNVYYLIKEVDERYCIDIIGHEDITYPLANIRDENKHNALKNQILSEYGNLEEKQLVRKAIEIYKSGDYIYSFLNLRHKAFIIDNYQSEQIDIFSKIGNINKKRSAHIEKKYGQELYKMDEEMLRFESETAGLLCDLAKSLEKKQLGVFKNLNILYQQILFKKALIVLGGTHSQSITKMLSDAHISYITLRPHGIDFIPSMRQLFSHCPEYN